MILKIKYFLYFFYFEYSFIKPANMFNTQKNWLTEAIHWLSARYQCDMN